MQLWSLSPHNLVSFGGCLAKNEFLNSQRCQCSSKTDLRKSKNTNVLLILNSKWQLCLLLWSLMEVTECSHGLNLSPHNFVSFGSSLAKNRFLDSQRCQCSSRIGLRKSKNTDV